MPTLRRGAHFESGSSTGTGTQLVAYLSPSPTLFKHEINIYWPLKKNKLTNKESVLNVNFDHNSKEMLSFSVGDGLR